jgi:uncharacterized membrane protein YphA (DoxX/SURF4 family)
METVNRAAVPMEASRASSHPVLWWIGTFGGAFLGVVLLIAVWAKMLDPASFAEQISTEGLDFLIPAPAVALIALALEAVLGLLLLFGVRRLWVLVPATLLVAFFVFLTGRTYWLAEHGLLEKSAGCGCFGNLVQRTPAQAFWQDLALLVPALLLAFVGRDRRAGFPRLRTAAAVLGAVAVAVFAWKAPDLPLDDMATRLRPGVAVNELCVGGGEEGSVCLSSIARELEEGEHLVLMSNLDDPALTEMIQALNAYADQPGRSVVLLSASPPEQHRAFFWQWGPSFEVHETPAELMRPLYRRLPRAFEVSGGRVTKTYAGLPPLAQTAQNHP